MDIFKKRKNTSLYDRKFYSEMLSRLVDIPSLQDMERVYELTYTEATDKNLEDIFRYIDRGNYFKLSRIKNRLTCVMDLFGITINANVYRIFLLIDKHKQYYLTIVYIQLVGDYVEKLICTRKVDKFFYYFFCNRRLIYPI